MNGKAYESHNESAAAKLLFLCDHASSAVPDELGTLGLDDSDFARHIASDLGAGALTRDLSARFEAPAIIGRWSRLVVDLNRGADDPTVVAKLSDGRIVPGNATLDRAGVEDRIARYHALYHETVAAKITEALARGLVPIIVSMHSFTPVWRGVQRPWHIGVLWDRDGRLALPMMERLRREKDLVVGDNEPYTGALENDCLYRHGTMNGLPHVLIEVRQDLIADPAGAPSRAGIEHWGARIARCLGDALQAMGPPTILVSKT
ncbi:MAG: N-formylglutamate amidohydrolase [Alphaproteobacteria bacterium]|nr:N-formylglutamate amidohydrolase [Alphaproteobacteria bacterium]